MQKLIILLIALSMLLITSCGLDRNNPLDPTNTGVDAPTLVTNLAVSSSGVNSLSKWVMLTWNPLTRTEADGYFVYRSRSYNGTYQRINNDLDDAIDVSFSSYQDNAVTSGAYFYKISAYKYLHPETPNPNERLEGPLNPSEFGVGLNVPE